MTLVNPTVTKDVLKSEVLRIASILNKTPSRKEYLKYRTLVGGGKEAISILFGKNAWNSLLSYCELPLVMRTPAKTEVICLVECKTCKKKFNKKAREIEKTNNNFCSHSCSAVHTNKNKTTGTRVSKLEKYVQLKLTELFPSLDVKYNNVDCIQYELDIYIPVLNLAFELDGIFHSMPIYGEERFSKQKARDKLKDEKCKSLGVNLIRIDTSAQKAFNEKSSVPYLDIIVANIKNYALQYKISLT